MMCFGISVAGFGHSLWEIAQFHIFFHRTAVLLLWLVYAHLKRACRIPST